MDDELEPSWRAHEFDRAGNPHLTCERSADRKGEVRALIVGINRYLNEQWNLAGSENDVGRLSSALASRGVAGVSVQAVVGEQATRDGVVDSLQRLIDESGCHDFVFLHFSVRSATWSPPRAAGLPAPAEDLALFLFDTGAASGTEAVGAPVGDWQRSGPGLTGEELRSVVTALRERGAFPFVSLDVCHAAALELHETLPAGLWRWSPFEARPAPALGPGASGYAAFFAAPGGGNTLELRLGDEGRVYGLFSFALAAALEDPDALSIRQMAERIADLYRRSAIEGPAWARRPIFESTNPDLRVLVALDQQMAPTPTIDASPLEVDAPPRTRGLALVPDPARFVVSGRLPRTDGLLAVTANAVPATVAPDGRFTATVSLEEGETRVYVLASYRDYSLAQTNFAVAKEGSLAASIGSGRSFALVIANQDYHEPSFTRLTTPIHDGESVAEALRSRFGFATSLPDSSGKEASLFLPDATRVQIYGALARLSRVVGPEDSVLIYYAGHGVLPPGLPEAYWLPVDADADSLANWVSASDLTAQARLMKARHVLVVSDSCYSGLMTREAGPAPASTGNAAELERYVLQAAQRTSRMLMSSGSNEPVWDGGGDGHSVFARAFLRGLDSEAHEVFTAEQLFLDYVKVSVAGGSKQSPQYQPIRDSGHDGGDFVFRRSPGPASGR